MGRIVHGEQCRPRFLVGSSKVRVVTHAGRTECAVKRRGVGIMTPTDGHSRALP